MLRHRQLLVDILSSMSIYFTSFPFLVLRAFCNPADLEAFTEEKKQSLLKRQGRGADFVRAVKEIVDSFEKSKKQDEADGSDSTHEVALLAGGNSAESSAPVELNGAAETSEATVTG